MSTNPKSTSKFSAQFTLYREDGLAISFNVGGDKLDDHLKEMDAYLSRLEHIGLRATPAEMKPGEQLQEVDGWVLGETSTGDACVFLYKAPLSFKVATVYVEDMDQLPIDVKQAKNTWPGAAPERGVAESKKYLQPCSFTVVMEPTGKTSDKGNPITRFARVMGSGPKPADGTPAPSAEKQAAPSSYAGVYDLLDKESRSMCDWVRKRKDDKRAPEELVQQLSAAIDVITGNKGSGFTVLEAISGISSEQIIFEPVLPEQASAKLLNWITPKVTIRDGGEERYERNEEYKQAYVDTIARIWKVCLEEHQRAIDT